MKLIFGLGNPGFRYRNTRHNIGFLACRALARKNGWKFRNSNPFCKYLVAEQGGEKLVLAMPRTFMNRSGEAVAAMRLEFPSDTEELLVIADDFQLPMGSLRFRSRGSSGGHKGLQSVCDSIGEEFSRLRLGIGPKPVSNEINSFVLGRWSRKEKKEVDVMLERAVPALETFVSEGAHRAASRHNYTAQKENSV